MINFDQLEPRQKKQIIWAVVGIILFSVIMVGYNLRSNRTLLLAGDQESKVVELEPNLIQKTMLREQRREIDKLKADLAELKNEKDLKARTHQANEKQLPEIPTADEVATITRPAPPVVEVDAKTRWPLPMGEKIIERSASPPAPGVIHPEPIVIGEIAVISNPEAELIEEPKKKEGQSIFRHHS